MTKTEMRQLSRLAQDSSKPDNIRLLAHTALAAIKEVERSRKQLTASRSNLAHHLNALDKAIAAASYAAAKSKELHHA